MSALAAARLLHMFQRETIKHIVVRDWFAGALTPCEVFSTFLRVLGLSVISEACGLDSFRFCYGTPATCALSKGRIHGVPLPTSFGLQKVLTLGVPPKWCDFRHSTVGPRRCLERAPLRAPPPAACRAKKRGRSELAFAQ
jgi:hypothetical protein